MRLFTKVAHVRQHELITQDNPRSVIAEAYRTLRTNLHFAGMDHACHTVLISSASPMDGKSTVTANLAVVMAQAGHQVLLVDCDLRKPVQHSIFNLDNRQGFTNCLIQQIPVKELAHQHVIKNLAVLTSGPIPPNPAEILGSERAREFWKQASKEYDFILIDAPPVLAVTDAVVLSSQVDGVILVIRSSVTRKELACSARDQFIRANARILGVVLNQVRMKKQGYHYYYYEDSTDY